MSTIFLYLLMAVGVIAAFGLAVFVHELGHFLAAKAFKVPVKRFVIGMDKEAMPFLPRCFWEKEINGTVYGISAAPLGGYVQMEGIVHPDIERYLDGEDAKKGAADGAETGGEGDDNSLLAQSMADQSALYKRPFYQKVIIYSAGVLMNFLLAMVVVAFVQMKGERVDVPVPSVIGWQAEDSYLASHGLLQGDRLVSVNGEPVATDEDFFSVLDGMAPRKESELRDFSFDLAMVFDRDGETIEHAATIPWAETETLGALSTMFARPAYAEYVIRNEAAHRGGMKEGDTIIRVGEEVIDDWGEFVHIIRASLGERLEIVVDRGGEEVALSVTPKESLDGEGRGQIGVFPGTPEKRVLRATPVEAMVSSPGIIVNNITRYVQNLKRIGGQLVQGEVSQVRRQLGGPVAIAQMAAHHTRLGLDRWLQFLILLNIALGVMNLLPFPILDGGHIVFAVYEGIFRKPVPPQVLVPVLQGGVYFIIGFFLLVTFSDVFKWFGL